MPSVGLRGEGLNKYVLQVGFLGALLAIALTACSGDSDSTEGSLAEDSHGIFPTGSSTATGDPPAEPESTIVPQATPIAAPWADITFTNGRVITMEPDLPVAEGPCWAGTSCSWE